MPKESTKPDLPFVAADVAAELVRWRSYLASERRMSAKTVESYARDVRQFLAFLAEHFGGRLTLATLVRASPRDVRAFMAARRADGISGRSLTRNLAGARSFAKFIERIGNGRLAALGAVRAPKIAKTLPKPLPVAEAKRVPDTSLRAGDEREPWILAATAQCWRSSTVRACAFPRRSDSSARTRRSPVRRMRSR